MTLSRVPNWVLTARASWSQISCKAGLILPEVAHFRHYPLPIESLAHFAFQFIWFTFLIFGFPFTFQFIGSNSYDSLSFAHQGLLIHSVHLFSLLNMKKISIYLQLSFGNAVTGVTFILALCQWGKFSRGKNCLIENVIQNKHRAGKADEQWNKQKVDNLYHFWFETLF